MTANPKQSPCQKRGYYILFPTYRGIVSSSLIIIIIILIKSLAQPN